MNNVYSLCKSDIERQLNVNYDNIILLDTVDSTNSYCKAHKNNLGTQSLVVSLEQTAGRGRQGKSFFSPANRGLYFTMALKRSESPSNIAKYTILVAVAVVRTISALTQHRPSIKWVNDIFVNDKKTAGILCECTYNNDCTATDTIIIGVGINLKNGDFPLDIANIATTLDVNVDINTIIAHLANNIYNTIYSTNQSELIEEYKSYSIVLHKTISFTLNDIAQTGTVVDILPDGALVLDMGGKLTTINCGEISLGSSDYINKQKL
ncbi:MAG: biotin--[acetyl-CoA-carboxylase] ligase [Bacillota bacterium]